MPGQEPSPAPSATLDPSASAAPALRPEPTPVSTQPSAGSKLFKEQVLDAFFPGIAAPNLGSTLKNNAALDKASISTLLAKLVASTAPGTPAPKVEEPLPAGISPTVVYVQYSFPAPGLVPAQVVFLDVAVCADAATAQDAVRLHLDTFTGDVVGNVKPVDRPRALGLAGLYTAHEVFWVRDAVFVRLRAVPAQVPAPPATPTTGAAVVASATAGPVPGSSGAAAANPTPAEKLLLPLAVGIDTYLAAGAVEPRSLPLPRVVIDPTTASIKAKPGEVFSVKIAPSQGGSLADLHEVRPAMPAKLGTIIPTTNGDSAGEWKFFAAQPGETKVRLLVARRDNLALGGVDFEVEVVA